MPFLSITDQTLLAMSAPQGPGFTYESFESYNDGVSLVGLTGGYLWNGAYLVNSFGITEQDTFEGYSDTSALNGLNGGQLGWNGAYVSR